MRFGLVGSNDSGKEILLNYLEKHAIEKNHFNSNRKEAEHDEYFVVVKQIPIKIKAFLANSLGDFINSVEKINFLDAIILTLNIKNDNLLEQYKQEEFKEFCKILSFEGFSVLTAINIGSSPPPRINRDDLINISKELNLLYCFEITNDKEDLLEFYEKIFNDFIFKFQYSSSELFDKAKKYGNFLLKINTNGN